MLSDASVCFDSMLGKCVANGSVVVVISLLPCSFIHGGQSNNRKWHRPDQVTVRTLFAPSPLSMRVLSVDK